MVFFSKGFIVYFSMYFCSLFLERTFELYYAYFFLSSLFPKNFKVFLFVSDSYFCFPFLRFYFGLKIKKIVICCFDFWLVITLTNFFFFIKRNFLCLFRVVLFYNNTLVDFCQYFFKKNYGIFLLF